MASKVSMVVLEDDAIFRQGIEKMIAGTKDLHCEASFGTIKSLTEKLEELESEVFWVDLSLPDGSGTDVIKSVLNVKPSALCLVCSLHGDDNHIFEAMKAGASGYLLKDTSLDKMLESIYELLKGGSPMSPFIARKLIWSFRVTDSNNNSILHTLTDREREVLEIIAKGHLYKEVADKLGISIETVKKHLRSIYTKLQVQNRTEAVVKYLGKS